jgi:F-type H+-transporting ATPase subunit gamma
MDTLQSLQRKLEGANDLKSVVRTMKAVSASNIGQYEAAVNSLSDYYQTILLGIAAFFNSEEHFTSEGKTSAFNQDKNSCAIVFGSDQGLVGRFNDSMADFVSKSLIDRIGKKEIWSVGERVQLLLSDTGVATTHHFPVPNSVNAITPLIGQIISKIEAFDHNEANNEVYVFYHQTKENNVYIPVMKRLLPLDDAWKQSLDEVPWATRQIPQIIGGRKITLQTLISEYLFVTLFRASVESLASENASRLAAMQRAEKNIGELLEELGHQFHRLRQSAIDEELFDVVSGFEALNIDSVKLNHGST